MSLCPSILVVDDEKNTREGLKQFLEAQDYDVLLADCGDSAWDIFRKEKPDLVLADIRMPGLNGIGLMEKIIGQDPSALIILMTAYGTVEDAVKAMKKGAFYYLTKPVNLEELDFLVKKALASQDLQEENQELKRVLFHDKFDQGRIVFQSEPMRALMTTVERIAPANSTVLIEGESGTGKELVAHRIHQLSPRREKPFVAVHCGALAETLLASELFGHERGAFTGAAERKSGRFERANGGTLFLDEIGEISQDMQVKLLRVIQEGEIERVGGTKTIKVDVRIICATNKLLAEEVRKGKFREDLYYRINVIYLHLPPLRERKEDIPLLAESFIKTLALSNGKKIRGITPEALGLLKQYDWPGNIRELKNIVERMVVLASDGELTAANIPEDIRRGGSAWTSSETIPAQTGQPASLAQIEKDVIRRTLSELKGNKSSAAKKLGISRRTLYRKISEYGLSDES